MKDTRQKIIQVAEVLFAAHGYAATSIRKIVDSADVNLAAIHYHFGSKEALFLEVLRKRLDKLNKDRHRMLEETKGRFDTAVPVETIIEAFLIPILKMYELDPNSGQFLVMLGRAFSESTEIKQKVFQQFFRSTAEEFLAALQEALPDLSQAEIYYRFHFMISTMVGTLMEPERLTMISGGTCQSDEMEKLIGQMIKFITAGFEEGR